MSELSRKYLLFAVVIAIGVSIWYLSALKPRGGGTGQEAGELASRIVAMNKEDKARRYEPARELAGIAGYVNTDGISIGDLIGKKVVLVDFWTYSCINCQRTTPYLVSWYDKYKDKGLEIIGVHTPEFQFEHVYANVVQATQNSGIEYPVVLDNDYATWRAYGNRYWPRKYLIDIDGFIVYDHIGEGAYAETERKIQELLGERMARMGMEDGIAQELTEPEGEASVAKSPEVYFGSARNEYLGSGTAGKKGVQTLTIPANTKANTLYLGGEWEFSDEYAKNRSREARIVFRYQAKNVFFVAQAGSPVVVTLLRDGKPLGAQAGSDVMDGSITISESRLYKLIEESAYGEHALEIMIHGAGLEAFTFTFG